MIKNNYIRGKEEGFYINKYLPDYVANLVSQTYITNRTTQNYSKNIDPTTMAKNSIEIMVRGVCREKGRELFNSLLPIEMRIEKLDR